MTVKAPWSVFAETCSCGHIKQSHVLPGHPDYRVRAKTRCAHVSGVTGTPCSCAAFDPVETVWRRQELRRLPVGVNPNAEVA